jgi:hypothetical protein
MLVIYFLIFLEYTIDTEVEFITQILLMYYISNIYYSEGLTEGEVVVNEREGRRAKVRGCFWY